MKKIPTIENIRDNFLSDIKNKLYTNSAGIPMLQRSTWVILGTALAGILRAGYEFSRYQYLQIFTSTADLISLQAKGEQYNIYLKQGTFTQIEICIKGDEQTVIANNTQIIANNIIYITNKEYIIKENGEILAEATATSTGSHTALPINTILELVSPIAGIENECAITKIIFLGNDIENIENYRLRVSQFERARPQGGAIPDFVNWTLEVPGITFAFIQTPKIDNRTVTVYPLTDGSGGTRIPSKQKIAEVLAYLIDPVRLPPCNVVVEQATEITVNVIARGLSPDTQNMKTLIEEAWSKMLLRKYPIQYSYENNANNLISSSIFSSEALLTGAKGLDVEISIATGQGTPYALEIGEIAKLGGITWA